MRTDTLDFWLYMSTVGKFIIITRTHTAQKKTVFWGLTVTQFSVRTLLARDSNKLGKNCSTSLSVQCDDKQLTTGAPIYLMGSWWWWSLRPESINRSENSVALFNRFCRKPIRLHLGIKRAPHLFIVAPSYNRNSLGSYKTNHLLLRITWTPRELEWARRTARAKPAPQSPPRSAPQAKWGVFSLSIPSCIGHSRSRMAPVLAKNRAQKRNTINSWSAASKTYGCMAAHIEKIEKHIHTSDQVLL